MPDLMTVSFYTRAANDLYQAERLRAFLTELSQLGHYLAGSESETISAAWMVAHYTTVPEKTRTRAQSIDPQSLFIPTVTSTLWQNVEAFVQHRTTNELSVSVYSTQRTGPLAHFRCTLTFYASESQIDVTMADDTDSIEDYLHYLDVLQLVYTTWHPLYGYQDDPSGDVTSLEEARRYDIRWLYDINLFGPEIVDQLGRERVLSTPAWLVKTLNDNGVLLVPALYRNGGRDEEYRFSREEAAQHLHLHSELAEEE